MLYSHNGQLFFLKQVLETGEEILKQTPEMLPVLKKAGVVDAGGRGIIIIFTGFYKLLMGDEDLELQFDDEKKPQTVDDVIADINALEEIQFGFDRFGLALPFGIGVHLEAVLENVLPDDEPQVRIGVHGREQGLEGGREDHSSLVVHFAGVFAYELDHILYSFTLWCKDRNNFPFSSIFFQIFPQKNQQPSAAYRTALKAIAPGIPEQE